MQIPKNTYAIDAQWSSTGRQQAGALTGSKKSSESLLIATTDGVCACVCVCVLVCACMCVLVCVCVCVCVCDVVVYVCV